LAREEFLGVGFLWRRPTTTVVEKVWREKHNRSPGELFVNVKKDCGRDDPLLFGEKKGRFKKELG